MTRIRFIKKNLQGKIEIQGPPSVLKDFYDITNKPSISKDIYFSDDNNLECSLGDKSDHVENVQELEATTKGKIRESLTKLYLKKVNSPFLLIVVIMLFLMTQILSSACDYYISFWYEFFMNVKHFLF